MGNTNMKRQVPMMQLGVAGAKLSIEYNWLQGAESLLFWGGFIATQASRADPCTSLNERAFHAVQPSFYVCLIDESSLPVRLLAVLLS